MCLRTLVVCCCAAGALIVGGCGDDSSNNATPVTTDTYEGAVYDSVMAAMLESYQMTYDSTYFAYELSSDGNYVEEMNMGFSWATVEVGVWEQNGTTITFTPVSDSTFNQQTMSMVEVATKAPYNAVEGTDGSLTIDNYITIADSRPLGTLVLFKQ